MKKGTRDGFSSEYRKRHNRKPNSKKFEFCFSTFVLKIALFVNVIGMLATVWISIFLPSVGDLENLMGKESTVFYDVKGEVIYTVNSEELRENISIDTLNDYSVNATIAIEDDKFYSHNGFDIGGLAKAVLSEFGVGSPRGGSTITQQFIKNSLLSRERTYTRKFKELILAAKLEKSASKKEILEMYLNRIPYGGQAYGIEKASQVFFDKNASELTLVESAVLAALPNAPTYYSPFGDNKFSTITKEFTLEEISERNIEELDDLNASEWNYGLLGKDNELANGTKIFIPGRADNVLRRMHELDMISDAEFEQAKLDLREVEFNQTQIKQKAYHFVTYVKSLLEKEFGKDMVENAGLKVYTTIDLDFQLEAEKIVKEQGKLNENYNINNAALLSIEPETGYIKAMVGSKDFANVEIEGFNNMVLANRQPGSSFKPIVFASAFERGLAPGHTIFDIPIKIGEDKPQNYDGSFMGPISVRKALGQSRNIPAVKAYYVAGEQDSIISFTEKLGIKSLDRRSDYGWPLSLGTGEMSLFELAQAYSVFANEGKYREINPILKVEDENGEILLDNRFIVDQNLLEEVVSPEVTFLINDILSDSSVNLGQRLLLPDRKVAAKTGTSTKKIDNVVYPTNLYTVGWTKDLVTIAWAGNTDGSQGSLNASGYSQAGPIWQQTMLAYHKDMPVRNFTKPQDVNKYAFSTYSGKIPSPNTPTYLVSEDFFIDEFKPSQIDDVYFEATVDQRNRMLVNEYCPKEYVQEIKFIDNLKMELFSEEIQSTYKPNLLVDRQNEIRDWFNTLNNDEILDLKLGSKVAIGSPILEESDLCKKEFAENILTIEAKDFKNGFLINRGNTDVNVNLEAEAGVEKVEFYVNDFLKFTTTTAPYKGLVRITSPNGTPVQLKLKMYDKNDYVVEKNYNLIVGDQSKNPKEPEENLETPEIETSKEATNELIINPDGLANKLEFDLKKLEN